MSTSTSAFIARQVSGYLGLLFWSVQLIPQVYHTYMRKSTDGLSLGMMSIWYLGSVVFFLYTWLERLELPILLQPLCYASLTLVCILQDFYYERKWRKRMVMFSGLAISSITVGILSLVYWIVGISSQPVANILITILGIIPTITASSGYFFQFYELYQTRNPFGISLLFIGVDEMGAVCFIISVLLYQSIAWLAFASYVLIFSFNAMILVICFTWRYMLKRRDGQSEEDIFINHADPIVVTK